MNNEELHLRRRRLHMTLKELSQLTGIHFTTISSYELGNTKFMRYDYMTRIIKAIESAESQQSITTAA